MSNLDEFRRAKINTWPIVLLRVYTGSFFAWHGVRKITNPDFDQALVGFVDSNLGNSVGFFRPFLEGVVLPNPGLFAFIVGWSELIMGFCLLIGLATRWVSIGGAVMMLAFWMTKGQGLFDGQNHNVIWIAIFIVLAGLHAGRTTGLDARFGGRFPFLA